MWYNITNYPTAQTPQHKLRSFFIYSNMKKLIILFTLSSILILSAFTTPDLPLFLTGLGYEFSEDFTKTTFTLPLRFDMVYNNYNELQKEAGFDLLPYRGKECIMYTYQILNHPFGKANANIIVYRGDIIGGDISSVNLDGFMTPLQ